MPRHRTLALKTFVLSVSPDLLARYFKQLNLEKQPEGWELMNPDAMQTFLDDQDNVAASAIVLEEFRRINDLCGRGMTLVTTAFANYGIPFLPEEPALDLAMRLYLDHRDAFDYAWSRYLLMYGASSMLTCHHLEIRDIDVRSEDVKGLEADLAKWFTSLAKGSECHVQHFQDASQQTFLVSRGSYLRNVAHWQGNQVAFMRFRPASEDVLVFNSDTGELAVQASVPKERAHYLRAFAACIAKDESLADKAVSSPLFTLAPLSDGTFSFKGNHEISDVSLTRVKMKLAGLHAPLLDLRSDNVQETMRSEFNWGLERGELTCVELRFQIGCEGERPVQVSVEIEPPSRTDLAEKRYADIIVRYLRQQKVKLF